MAKLTAVLIAAILAVSSVSAQKTLPLPYKKCDRPAGCKQVATSIVGDGPNFNFTGSQVFRKGSDGILLTAPISRSYVVAADGKAHEMFYLKNRALSIEIDVSKVQCGYNAAFYFSNMPANASIGTGYCDAQKPLGAGGCNEMDVIEANIGAHALASHSCDFSTNACDPWGCGVNTFNSYHSQVGAGKYIDTLKPFTVLTNFHTDDGTDKGTLSNVTQSVIQGSHVLNFPGLSADTCQYGFYWPTTGQLPAMSKALDSGMTMIFSFWGSGGDGMSWLDGYPNNADCGNATTTVNQVTFAHIKVAYIGK